MESILVVFFVVIYIFCWLFLPGILERRSEIRRKLAARYPASVVVKGKFRSWRSTVSAAKPSLTWASSSAMTRRGCLRKTARALYKERMYLLNAERILSM